MVSGQPRLPEARIGTHVGRDAACELVAIDHKLPEHAQTRKSCWKRPLQQAHVINTIAKPDRALAFQDYTCNAKKDALGRHFSERHA